MAAAKATYVIVWKKSNQVYSATNLETALKTPIPKGNSIEDKRILLMNYEPDLQELQVYQLTEEQINNKVIELQEKADGKEK